MLKDQRGGVMVMIAVFAVVLIGFIGLAIDAGRAYLARSRLSSALDAAALAQGGNTSSVDAATYVQMYLAANFPPNFMGVPTPTPKISGDGLVTPLTISAELHVPTTFMRLLGFDDITVSATTAVNQAIRAMELALVLDNTGSLGSTNMENVRKAAHDLVNIVYGGLSEHSNLWVSVVPFTSTVNIDSSRIDWIDGSDKFRVDKTVFGNATGVYDRLQPNKGGWKGCVEARPTPWDEGENTPADKPFATYLYPAIDGKDDFDNVWTPATISMNTPGTSTPIGKWKTDIGNKQRGPNIGCPTPMLSLTKPRATVDAAIDAMELTNRGGTTTNIGLLWGWRMLSPDWRSAWGGVAQSEGRPFAYDDVTTEKVIVMMTDGENQFFNWSNDNGDNKSAAADSFSDYTAYGRKTGCPKSKGSTMCSVSELDTAMTDVCTKIKAKKIRIYTIAFGGKAGPGTTISSILKGCASDPAYFFDAPTATDLSKAFRTIGKQLSNLRLSG